MTSKAKTPTPRPKASRRSSAPPKAAPLPPSRLPTIVALAGLSAAAIAIAAAAALSIAAIASSSPAHSARPPAAAAAHTVDTQSRPNTVIRNLTINAPRARTIVIARDDTDRALAAEGRRRDRETERATDRMMRDDTRAAERADRDAERESLRARRSERPTRAHF